MKNLFVIKLKLTRIDMEEYVIVNSEGGDWYLIPHLRLKEWENSVRFTYEGEEDWVEYIPSPSAVKILSYEL